MAGESLSRLLLEKDWVRFFLSYKDYAPGNKEKDMRSSVCVCVSTVQCYFCPGAPRN